MFWLKLAWRSLLNRRLTVSLTVLAMAFSIALVLSVDKLRQDTRDSFNSTLSGTDLIVGARSGALNLLLYSVFRLGEASNNISWQSYQQLKSHSAVDWTVPLSLGDSHRGYRVLGTTEAYFEHYRYRRDRQLELSAGRIFDSPLDVVLGAEVARTLDYAIGDRLVVSHGIGSGFSEHDDMPFTVVGILAPTGTPVDRTLHVSLEGIEAIHVGWEGGVRLPGSAKADMDNLPEPVSITAFMVGMQSRVKTFAFQRLVNQYPGEPLMAIIPGVALQSLWQILSVAERAFLLISLLVVVTGLLGMLAVLLANMAERRREVAILRAQGVSALRLHVLLCGEALWLGALAVLLALALHYAGLTLVAPWLELRFGIAITLAVPPWYWWPGLGLFVVACGLLGAIPAYTAYRRSLADGLTMRT